MNIYIDTYIHIYIYIYVYIYTKTWGSGEYEEEEADQPDNSPPETPEPPSCVVPALFELSWAC